jgi:hypothetical protein
MAPRRSDSTARLGYFDGRDRALRPGHTGVGWLPNPGIGIPFAHTRGGGPISTRCPGSNDRRLGPVQIRDIHGAGSEKRRLLCLRPSRRENPGSSIPSGTEKNASRRIGSLCFRRELASWGLVARAVPDSPVFLCCIIFEHVWQNDTPPGPRGQFSFPPSGTVESLFRTDSPLKCGRAAWRRCVAMCHRPRPRSASV